MGLLKSAIKSGIAMKALQVAQREARKPENQRKIKEMIGKVTNRQRGATR